MKISVHLSSILAVSMALLATACSPETNLLEEDVEQNEDPIVGGTTETGQPRVISIQVPVSSGSSARKHWCTGYVVGHRAVLTAAHCLCDDYKASDFTFHNGSKVSGSSPIKHDGAVVRVKESILMGGTCGKGWRGQDVALLVLKDTLGLMRPSQGMAFYDIKDHPSQKNLTIFGYGRTQNDKASPGIKKKAVVQFDDLHDNGYGFDTKPMSPSQGVPCSGDSGAPIFMSGHRLVGVHSAGDALCLQTSSGFQENTRFAGPGFKIIRDKLLALVVEEESFGVNDEHRRKLYPDCDGDGVASSQGVLALSTEEASDNFDCPGGGDPHSWSQQAGSDANDLGSSAPVCASGCWFTNSSGTHCDVTGASCGGCTLCGGD